MLTFASMLKRNCIYVVVLLFLFSCGNKKEVVEPATVAEDTVSSIELVEDTVFVIEPEEPSLPTSGDETFDDFVYVFAADTAFQRSRVVFPLPYYEGDTPLKIEKEEWEHDSLFINQSYYTLLSDTEEELEQSQENSYTSVQIEWIYMKTHMVKKYYFERVEGRWMLEAINYRPIVKDKRADFVDFFVRFSVDSLYQSTHIRQPLMFVTSDPDDDFSIIETTLDAEQWFAFKPVLPGEKLTNIIYGQERSESSPYKIMQLKGVGNGFLNTLFFRRKGKENWELYKFEDTSN